MVEDGRCTGAGYGDAVLAELYVEHWSAVFLAASFICGRDAAEEVAQLVFLDLWRRPERFDPARGSMRTFLTSIARHHAIDALRREHSAHAREEADGRRTPPDSTEVDQPLLRRDDIERVRIAIASLDVALSEVIVMTFYREHTYVEAADLLGIPEGTLKSRVRRALRQIRSALQDDET